MTKPSTTVSKITLADPETYNFHTYGDRKWMRSNKDVPVHDFKLQNSFVAHNSALRCLNERELSQKGLSGVHCHTGFSLRSFPNENAASNAAAAELADMAQAGPCHEFDAPSSDRRTEQTSDGFLNVRTGDDYTLGQQNILVLFVCLENEAGDACDQGETRRTTTTRSVLRTLY